MTELAGFARIGLAHLPTPLEALPNLSRHLGGPAIYIKRDDCTGLGGGGNKVRKLEFLLGDAIESGADRVLTFGALQSNHVRQTAAACARLQMACEAILIDQTGYDGPSYRHSGNLLLDELFGARVHCAENESTAAHIAEKLIDDYGDSLYVIPAGGSNAVGALGYVNCAAELKAQFKEMALDVRAIVHASSSAGTQAGLIAGVGKGLDVLGINVYERNFDDMSAKVASLVGDVMTLLGLPKVEPEINMINDYLGAGYGLPTREMKEAVELAARLEGIILDPVYSGKAMAGLIGLIRSGYFGSDESVVFLHTGGSPALFAYPEVFVNGETS
ncbi:MAG: D-cysteine desulfhydrase family protein [Pseudomonadales bacterium]|nr:D-cysteine desulfhydrase family protein [Pseudomonadales bacterium]